MKDVEASVKAQKEDVVSCYVFDISQFVYHVELRQDREGLKPYTERPQEIHRIKGFVDDNGC